MKSKIKRHDPEEWRGPDHLATSKGRLKACTAAGSRDVRPSGEGSVIRYSPAVMLWKAFEPDNITTLLDADVDQSHEFVPQLVVSVADNFYPLALSMLSVRTSMSSSKLWLQDFVSVEYDADAWLTVNSGQSGQAPEAAFMLLFWQP